MAGITNYYHGEFGFVADCGYDLSEKEPVYVLYLEDDPHREFTFAYGGDIHIDPLLETGDKAKYIRVDRYGGIWVRERHQYYPELQQAIGRVVEEQRGWHLDQKEWHPTKRYISEDTRRRIEDQPKVEGQPSQQVALTLSHATHACRLGRVNLSAGPYVHIMRCGSTTLKSAVRSTDHRSIVLP